MPDPSHRDQPDASRKPARRNIGVTAWLALEPLLAAVLACSAVAAALVSQHVFDMQPCPWCVLQRLIFVAGAALGLAEWTGSLLRSPRLLIRLGTALRMACAAAGLAAAAWQHFVAAASASCNLTLADRILAFTTLDALLPDIFQPRASCLDAKVSLLGLPYEGWSALLYAALLAMAAGTMWLAARRAGSATG